MRQVLFSVLLLFSPLLSAEIYKTVDENGNVIYTDQKPAPNAKPIDLPDLNVAEPHRNLPTYSDPVEEDSEASDREFSITSPEPEENIWGSGGEVTVRIDNGFELRTGMNIVVYLDGEAHEAGRSLSLTIDQVERGEHRVYAELQARNGRVVATTDEVVFYMKQQSSNFPTGNRSNNRNNRNNGNNGR